MEQTIIMNQGPSKALQKNCPEKLRNTVSNTLCLQHVRGLLSLRQLYKAADTEIWHELK